ncbi:16S rRNA (cytosine(1402)-N(4))-methyltransferase RsmH, partial [candidate division WWE3 bacterium]|nr:16S rRNA (cytosine(1402)-N(4))-methyltransferase RsmH [candidate division WWE3 bacterium]
SGVLMDIGLSSYHLDQSGRGFSYKKDEPLDMRMNPQSARNAFEILNTYSEEKLYELFLHFGETYVAQELARRIASTRGISPIATTEDLVSLVELSLNSVTIHDQPRRSRVLATVFQALRIEVNDELNNLKQGLLGAVELLEPKGRLAVITFHSLEDRIVKLFYRKEQRLKDLGDRSPTLEEIQANSRSRSARLRIAEKK